MDKRAASILEYTVIFGIIAIVLFAMSTYVKRSFQAQVKDMADNFISLGSENQAADYYVNAIVTSNSATNASSNMISTDMLGGARGTTLNEKTESSSSSKVIDTRRIIDTPSSVSTSLTGAGYQATEQTTNTE